MALGLPALPVAEPEAQGVGRLVQAFLEHAFRRVRAIQSYRPQPQFPDPGYFHRLHIEVVEGFVLAGLVIPQLLAGRIFIPRTGPDAQAQAVPAIRHKIEIEHERHREIIGCQFVLIVADRIHDHTCRIRQVFDILGIAIVVQFDPKAILQIHDVTDKIHPLHEQPDIYIDGFDRPQMEPIGIGARRELLRGCRAIVRLIGKVRKAKIQDKPVDVFRLMPTVMLMPVMMKMHAVLTLSPVCDDQQAAHMQSVIGCAVRSALSGAIGLCQAANGRA